MQQLRRLLLWLGTVGFIEGCPDGEGGVAGATDQTVFAVLRRKGQFTDGFVDWVIASIRSSKMPLLFVDVGGIRSPYNERIFAECTRCLVLANPTKIAPETGQKELDAWEAFGRKWGCQPLALIESVLDGVTALLPDEGDGVLRGTQAGLERGAVLGGPVIEELYRQALELVGHPVAPGELETDLHTGRLAEVVGIPLADRQSARLGFRPWHVLPVLQETQVACLQPRTRFWGVCPGWLAAMVAAHANVPELWDIRLGWVTIPDLQQQPGGSDHLTWRVAATGDSTTVVSFTIPSGVFEPGALAQVAVPSLPATGGPVVLSGRGPHWLTAAIARVYARAGHTVAVAAPPETAEKPLGGVGPTWGEANPGKVPAVVINAGDGSSLTTGTVVAVLAELCK